MVKLAGRWLGVLLLLLLALATTTTAEEEPAYSCQQMSKVPKEERCQFVTTQCNPSGRIPVMELYYCSVEPAGFLAKIPFVVLLCLLLPLLFTLLGDTAEIYFSPNMSLVAQSIPKMRPRFAGVTFVAMGNGAADLSANVSAIRNGSVQLSAGAFTGAAMFVQCVVASEVIRISQGAPCRGATMRDVATFMVSLVGVALSFASGTITKWFVAGALVVYTLYAAWVFCGDEWHARGRPQPNVSWSQLLEMLKQRRHAEPSPQWAALEAAEPLIAAPTSAEHARAGPHAALSHQRTTSTLLDAETYRQAVWADLSSEPSMIAAIRTSKTQLSHESEGRALELQSGVSGGAAASGGGYSPPSASALPLPRVSEGEVRSPLLPAPAPARSRDLEGGHAEAGPGGGGGGGGGGARSPFLLDASQPSGWGEIDKQAEQGGPGTPDGSVSPRRAPLGGASVSTWQQISNELTVGAAEEWPELQGFRRHFRRITFPILLPMYALLRLTIPFIDPATYSQQWLVVTMLCCPLATVLYLEALQFWPVAVAMALGLAMAVSVHILTRDEEELPALDLGTSFAFGPALFSLMGFFMGVLWIDTLASEVVGILSLLATLAALPSSLVGLTLLAWGSSLGDLVGNSALARRGHASTALTACFAGPLFNMLVSLALGFSSYFASHSTGSIQVQLSPDVLLGCVFLLLYNLIVVVVGASNKSRLPQRFFLFARAWYVLYLVLACGLGLAEKAA